MVRLELFLDRLNIIVLHHTNLAVDILQQHGEASWGTAKHSTLPGPSFINQENLCVFTCVCQFTLKSQTVQHENTRSKFLFLVGWFWSNWL